MDMNILLVEDDESIVKNLTEILKDEGYRVESSGSVSAAKHRLAKTKEGYQTEYQLILLDISLPDGSGFELCDAANACAIPIIFLTASDDEDSVVKGFDRGGADYISKPFRVRELLSRIKNVLRKAEVENIIHIQDLQVDTDSGIVFRGKNEIPLSALEYRLLVTFVNHRGVLLTRNRLLEEIWDIAGDFVNDNTLTVYIKRLREKIEVDPQNPSIIKTVRGIGYRMD